MKLVESNKSIITNPNIYVTPDLLEGESAAIYIIANKQTFLSLKFTEGDGEIPFKPFLSKDNTLDLDKKPALKAQIKLLEDRIVNLGVVYTCYHYFLTVRGNNIYLLSTSLSKMSLGYEITKEIAAKVEIEVYKPIWTGTYTPHVVSAFVEDVFIQKL